MERYAQGDKAAFDELFQRYERRVYAYFVRRTGSPDRAQDLYQELFLRVHRFRHTFEAGGRFSSWFFRVASRVAIDDARRRKGHGALVPVERLDAEVPAAAEVAAVSRDLVRCALARLSAEQADILIAAKVDGRGYREIARRVGRSTSAVKQIASRALRGLRAAHAADA